MPQQKSSHLLRVHCHWQPAKVEKASGEIMLCSVIYTRRRTCACPDSLHIDTTHSSFLPLHCCASSSNCICTSQTAILTKTLATNTLCAQSIPSETEAERWDICPKWSLWSVISHSIRYTRTRACARRNVQNQPPCAHATTHTWTYQQATDTKRTITHTSAKTQFQGMPSIKWFDIHTHTYICIHIHICICVCENIYVHIYVYIYIHIPMYIYIYIYMYALLIYMYIHVHIGIYIYIYIHIHAFNYIYLYVYTYTYLYMYTYMWVYIYMNV